MTQETASTFPLTGIVTVMGSLWEGSAPATQDHDNAFQGDFDEGGMLMDND